MAFWNFWSEKTWEEEVAARVEERLKSNELEIQIGEPVQSIVNLIIKDRHRFLITKIKEDRTTIYKAVDTQTEESFTIKHHVFPPYGYDLWEGLFWMTSVEAKWAVEFIKESIASKKSRARRIFAANERNRLIHIYAKEI